MKRTSMEAAAAAALFLIILWSCCITLASSAVPEHITVGVEELYNGSSTSPLSFSTQATSGSNGAFFAATLTHRDSRGSPYRRANATAHGLVLDRLRRDAARVKSIAATISMASNGFSTRDLVVQPAAKRAEDATYNQETIAAALRSGLTDGSGEYFVTLGVGTPPRTVNLVADTGSDVLWIQCLPCQSCYGQSDPLFNPSVSSSFASVTCSNPLCSQLLIRGCRSNQCLYQVSYGDGSFTVGDFSTETLFFGQDSVQNVAIGCGHNNQGLFTGAAGLLGLGRGRLSFPSQVGPSYGNVFSYCLPSRESTGSVPLVFGEASIPSGTQFTLLETNPKLDTFYYLRMVGLRVGGQDLNIPSGALALDTSSGSGGVILDSGTAVTRLVTSVYTPLRDAFRAGMQRDVRMSGGFSLFDTCYDLSGRPSIMLPTVSLLFDNGAAMNLPAQNIMVPVDNAGTYCLAFAPNSDDFSIIGNIQQQSFRVSFDAQRSRVGFAGNQCS